MALCSQVVYLVGPDLLNDMGQTRRIGHIPVMQVKGFTLLVYIVKQMIDARRVEHRAAALHSMNLVTLVQQQLRKIGAILASNTRD